jgi:hypothetical protein
MTRVAYFDCFSGASGDMILGAPVTGRDTPDPAWRAAYEGLYPEYQALYGALKPTFDRLSS